MIQDIEHETPREGFRRKREVQTCAIRSVDFETKRGTNENMTLFDFSFENKISIVPCESDFE
jgi:hypothetical protein